MPKIRVNYREYKYSEEATKWSRIGGYLNRFGIFVMLLLVFIIDAITKAFILSMIITVLIAVAYAGVSMFCCEMELKCLNRDMPNLTYEERRELLERSWKYGSPDEARHGKAFAGLLKRYFGK